ncbi:MAG: GntR family transcriptional regulator [Deltaproteobacteria bacterium]|nr:GntR family transcriptional regulator [Deltaproteobacteria bacterium]
MNFNTSSPIYQQIAEYICDQIINGEFNGDKKLPSVRKLSADLEVNPNTVIHTFQLLTSQGIIANRRGIGMFCTPLSKDIILNIKRERFIKTFLPSFFDTMDKLGFSCDEICNLHNAYKKGTIENLAALIDTKINYAEDTDYENQQ